MPTIDFIGKKQIVNHHLDVPFRLLNKQYSCGDKDLAKENMIIHGDNLSVLKALLPRYEHKIKCIYIDPPYNTGNEGWVYNDNVNDPMIKKWLGEVVGKEGEDLTRHDKWLCMMYPRLRLLQKLLREDGTIVISIGWQEVNNLLMLCKEIFSSYQTMAVTVQNNGGKPSAGFTVLHDYLVFVTPKDFSPYPVKRWGGVNRSPFEGLTLSTFFKTNRPNQAYPVFIDRKTGGISHIGKSVKELEDGQEFANEEERKAFRENFVYDYSLADNDYSVVWPVTSKGKDCVFRLKGDRLMDDWKKGYISVQPNKQKGNKNEYSITYLPDGVIQKVENGDIEILGHKEDVPTLILGANKTEGGQIPTMWTDKDFFTVKGTALGNEIFPETIDNFPYPKPIELVKAVIQSITRKDEIVLDCFAGSGTTGHAVAMLNKEDGSSRRFIMVEMADYAETITAERMRRVINGYTKVEKDIVTEVEGLSSGFSYYELGEELFVEDNQLNEVVETEKIRQYIWFIETRSDYKEQENDNPYLLGEYNGTLIYFYYEKEKKTLLDYAFLSKITQKSEKYIIYADRCALTEGELMKFNIVFKKISRDIPSI